MNRTELLQRLDGTEWLDFELKSAQGGVPDDAFKTLSAFANSGGGWLVFGVADRDDGYDVQGIADVDRFQNDLLSACRSSNKLRRAVSIHPRLFRFDEGWVLALRVDEAPRFDKPVRVRIKGRWRAYVRVGAGDHQCTPEEEGRFVRDATHQRFDQTPCPDFDVTDLDADAAGWLRGLISLRNPDAADPAADLTAWLESAGLLRKDGCLTHAAALLFGKSQVMAALKPGGVVDFRLMHSLAADGMPPHRWDDRELCEGHLVSALRSLFDRFHRLCPQPFALEPEGPLRRARALEEEALREALLNLVAHQDYADVQRTATILWWRDRVVFYNPGDSYVDTADLWAGGFSETRNPLIARMLRQAGLAEQAGSGLPLIRRTWDQTGRPTPELRNDKGRKRFEMTFLWGEERDSGVSEPVNGRGERVNGPDERRNRLNERLNDGVNEPQGEITKQRLPDRVLRLLRAEPGVRVPELVARLGASEASVRRALKALKADGLVAFRGASKTGGYYATPSDDEDAGS